MITIGQLARYVGISTKTIRVYHAKGLLPEPERDASGYRRYSAEDAVELIKIHTLAAAGVPLARILELKAAPEDEFQAAIAKNRLRPHRPDRGTDGPPAPASENLPPATIGCCPTRSNGICGNSATSASPRAGW